MGWKSEAEAALSCGIDGCLMPTWSTPTPAQVDAASFVAQSDTSSLEARLRFRDVMHSYGSSGKLLLQWAGDKSSMLVGRVVPTAIKAPVKRAAIRVAARVAESRD